MKQNPFSFCRRKGFFYERIPLFKENFISYNWGKSWQTIVGEMIPVQIFRTASWRRAPGGITDRSHGLEKASGFLEQEGRKCLNT